MSFNEGKSSSSFRLGGTDGSFKNRSADVFSVLNTTEAKHEAFNKTQLTDETVSDHVNEDDPCKGIAQCASSSETLLQTGSEFKVPTRGAPKRKQEHSPKKDCSKWTHYDLSNVETTSAGGNRQAAMAFLQSRKQEQVHESPETTEDTSRILFVKPKTAKENMVIDYDPRVNETEIKGCSLLHLPQPDEETDLDPNTDTALDSNSFKTKAQFKKPSRSFRKKVQTEESSDEEDTVEAIASPLEVTDCKKAKSNDLKSSEAVVVVLDDQSPSLSEDEISDNEDENDGLT